MPYKAGKPCICEICNCGRHRCPHQPQTKAPFGPCSISEYSNKYIPHKIEVEPSCKPAAVAVKADGPLSDETTNRVDYVLHDLPEKYVHQSDGYTKPEGVMDGDSMYKTDYTRKSVPIMKLTKPEIRKRELGKFEGNPTYASDYRKWSLEKPPTRCGDQAVWNPPNEPFQGIPTYTHDYPGYAGLVRPANFKPEAKFTANSAPFDDQTDYRQSYVPHALALRKPREKTVYQKKETPFDGLTISKRDYTPKSAGMRVSCKPPPAPHASHHDPLQSDTTQRVDYVPWEVSRPALIVPPATHKPSEGLMDLDTSYKRDYLPHPGGYRRALTANARPAPRSRSLGPFEGTTDYRDSYKRWQLAGAPQRAGPDAAAYRQPAVPFEGESTFTAHYRPHGDNAAKRRSFKPEARRHEPGDFNEDTNYRLDYTRKWVEPCPAALLDTARSDYQFREQDTATGHKYYQASGTPPVPGQDGQPIRHQWQQRPPTTTSSSGHSNRNGMLSSGAAKRHGGSVVGRATSVTALNDTATTPLPQQNDVLAAA